MYFTEDSAAMEKKFSAQYSEHQFKSDVKANPTKAPQSVSRILKSYTGPDRSLRQDPLVGCPWEIEARPSAGPQLCCRLAPQRWHVPGAGAIDHIKAWHSQNEMHQTNRRLVDWAGRPECSSTGATVPYSAGVSVSL